MPVAMVAAAILVALIPIATNLPALAALGLLCAVLVVLIAGETFMHSRYRLRQPVA